MKRLTLFLRMRAEACPHLAASARISPRARRARGADEPRHFPCRPGMQASVTQRDKASSAFRESPNSPAGLCSVCPTSRCALSTASLSDSASQTQCLQPLCGVFGPRFLRGSGVGPAGTILKMRRNHPGPAALPNIGSHPLQRTLAFSARSRRRAFSLFNDTVEGLRTPEQASGPLKLGKRERVY
jgi:hypothetical protein